MCIWLFEGLSVGLLRDQIVQLFCLVANGSGRLLSHWGSSLLSQWFSVRTILPGSHILESLVGVRLPCLLLLWICCDYLVSFYNVPMTMVVGGCLCFFASPRVPCSGIPRADRSETFTPDESWEAMLWVWIPASKRDGYHKSCDCRINQTKPTKPKCWLIHHSCCWN